MAQPCPPPFFIGLRWERALGANLQHYERHTGLVHGCFDAPALLCLPHISPHPLLHTTHCSACDPATQRLRNPRMAADYPVSEAVAARLAEGHGAITALERAHDVRITLFVSPSDGIPSIVTVKGRYAGVTAVAAALRAFEADIVDARGAAAASANSDATDAEVRRQAAAELK